MHKLIAAVHGAGVRRRFVRVQGRGVHYLHAGAGSPVVLLHAGNSSARSMLPLLSRLVPDHAVFAFDHPGYGDSDPLPGRHLRLREVADALNETLLTLKIPRCPIYGSHSGADVALELARRHPERTAGLVLDGVTLFSARETKYFLGEEYMPPFIVKSDGSHLFSTWVKARDAITWFPWSKPCRKNRKPYRFPSTEGIHAGFVDRLRAGDDYQAVYGAAFEFDVRKATAAVAVPAVFMAAADDPLFPHLEDLPKLRANQRIIRCSDHRLFTAEYYDELARVVRSYRVSAVARAEAPFQPTRAAVNRRYVDLGSGQVLVRSSGEAVRGRPLLLLHDGRASSRVFDPLMRELGRRRPVYAPDLPDNGASDAFRARRQNVADYADAVAEIIAVLKIAPCDVYAVGAGAAVALDLLGRTAFSGAKAVLEAPDFYAPAFARRLAASWVPPLAPRWDGSHLNQLWLMLRDELAFWPWFDKSPAAACAVDAPESWEDMQARVTDILRSLATYHRLSAAALRYDWMRPLARMGKRRVILATTAQDPRLPHVHAAAKSSRLPDVAVLSAAAARKASDLLRLYS